VDPEYFYHYYQSNGWRVGKNPMRDWKAAVRTWESNEYGGSRETQKPDYLRRSYSENDFRAMEVNLDA
jgi:hypothetical protein